MLRIQRFVNEESVSFVLSGRIETENVAQLESLLTAESKPVALDLKEVNLVSREVVQFFEAVRKRWSNNPKLSRLHPPLDRQRMSWQSNRRPILNSS